MSAWPASVGPDGLKYRTAAGAALEPEPRGPGRVGWGFISLYTLAYVSTSLLFLAPVLVTLALKVDSPVGGKLSDRTGRRKIFVMTASLVHGVALFAVCAIIGAAAILPVRRVR